MKITYLGHAGFCVEDAQTIIIMDPWLSPRGAFDSSWFQYPRNHHLAALVQEKLADQTRKRFVYISHEHQDHFDAGFLESLECREFSLLVPHFRRSELLERLADYRCAELIGFKHEQTIPIANGCLRLYLDDSELNRDSAVLVRMSDQVFLNLNDCKLFDILTHISAVEGEIQTFACQFSGATWHPTCYEYDSKMYDAISRKKMMTKFETVAKAILTIRPRTYLPSAGPACFLDPRLMHLNFQKVNIFPTSDKLINYLRVRLRDGNVHIPDLAPGDVLEPSTGAHRHRALSGARPEDKEQYLAAYAALYYEYFQQRSARMARVNPHEVLRRLREELVDKLEFLTLADRVTVPLYCQLEELPNELLRVDCQAKTVELRSEICDERFYELRTPAWQIEQVLDRALTWEEFSLTFRVALRRVPDKYDPILHAYLLMDGEDLARYCDLILQLEANQERIVVEAGGRRYSILRFCPHQGGDLQEGYIERDRLLTCSRHRWQFDLAAGGKCTTNDTSVQAVCLSEPAQPETAPVMSERRRS